MVRQRIDPAGAGVLGGLIIGSCLGLVVTVVAEGPADVEAPAPVTVLIGDCAATLQWEDGAYEFWFEE